MPKIEQAKFGFTEYAERINSRYAMMGFFALLAVEGVRAGRTTGRSAVRVTVAARVRR